MDIEIIGITGVSGSGKTTVGKRLAEILDYQFIDLDEFFLPNKPKIILSNGKERSNWDSLQSIDISAFQNKIKQYKKVIVVGFALIDRIFPIKPKCTIWLKTGINKEVVIERCIENRIKSKKIDNKEKQEEDELMVREVVYPNFLLYLSLTTISIIISVYENDKRIPIKNLVEMILSRL